MNNSNRLFFAATLVVIAVSALGYSAYEFKASVGSHKPLTVAAPVAATPPTASRNNSEVHDGVTGVARGASSAFAPPERAILSAVSSYREAWDRLFALNTARSKTLRAAIIEACIGGFEAEYSNARFWHLEIDFGKDIERRESIRKSVASRSPRSTCAGIPTAYLNQATANSLLLEAAKAGDNIALLRDLTLKIDASKSQVNVHGSAEQSQPLQLSRSTHEFSSGDVGLIKNALLGGDPSAIWLALPIAYTTADSEQFWLGSRMLGEVNLQALADVLACDFGASCDSTSPRVAEPCVIEGKCDVASVEDHYRRQLSQAEWEAVDYARSALRDGINRGDLAALQLKPVKSDDVSHRWLVPFRPYPIRIR
jgi:hypothetical protein